MGAGIFCINSSPQFENLIITQNSYVDNDDYYTSYGIGAYCAESNPKFQNVIFAENSLGDYGDTFCSNYDSLVIFNNVTFANNLPDYYDHEISFYESNVIIQNSIIRNNPYQIIVFYANSILDTLSISYSNIEGGIDGIYSNSDNIIFENNLDLDPLFTLNEENPYSVSENSPCIDSGTPDVSDLDLPLWDILGNERIWDGNDDGTAIIDMGAYEFGAPLVGNNLDEIQIPEISLHNFPNPFNPETNISFSLKQDQKIKLEIFNIKGQKVRTLHHGFIEKGKHTIKWNGKDMNKNQVASGIYFYQLSSSEKRITKRMLLLK